MLSNHYPIWLLILAALPLATALVVLVVPSGRHHGFPRWLALVGTATTLVLSLGFVPLMLAEPGQYVASVHLPWIRSLDIRLIMGLDGLSGSLVVLTNLLMVASVLASWTAITQRSREFYFYLMLLQTGVLGTFLALDLILFYIFFELMLVPLYFLIGIFGSGRRLYATLKFFLYTFAGSLLMLVGILALHGFSRELTESGRGTFSALELIELTGQMPPTAQLLIFLAFLIAFMIKVPIFPLHTWLPDAHTEAPTAGSVILAGVLLKTGIYGLMRFALPMFPHQAAQFAPLIIVLALIAIIYGALVALAQADMKRLVAYSSVSHMGFVVLGLFAFQPEATTGAALQMINHGISTGALFICVGFLYERRHTRLLAEFGGLGQNMKIYASLTGIIVLSSLGLPGLNGFVGEFLILLGAYQVRWWWAVVAATGVILAACYLLRMMQWTFFGALDRKENKVLKDLNPREILALIVLAALTFWIGLYPKPFLRVLEPASRTLIEAVEKSPVPLHDPLPASTQSDES